MWQIGDDERFPTLLSPSKSSHFSLLEHFLWGRNIEKKFHSLVILCLETQQDGNQWGAQVAFSSPKQKTRCEVFLKYKNWPFHLERADWILSGLIPLSSLCLDQTNTEKKAKQRLRLPTSYLMVVLSFTLTWLLNCVYSFLSLVVLETHSSFRSGRHSRKTCN